jgi:hypothetical protein
MQARRLKQIESKKEKLARKGHTSAKEKREPKIKPSHSYISFALSSFSWP